MKKAVLYARVSSDLQRREKTVESQVEGLKKQIVVAGHLLVKEYIDAGWSGSRLDRPALDTLRKDLKTDLFEAVYFWSSDRIAREVTYQNIIISELIKAKKQIIINGRDYVENPENKFTLQIFGAVDEFEKAKIIERTQRGKQHKLAAGFLMSGGSRLFGYNYICKTQTSPPRVEINEKEAKIVRFVFKEYAKGGIGMNQITRKLEDMGATSKTGKKLWGYSAIQNIFHKRTYTGVRYFNTMRLVTEYANPISGAKMSKKLVPREKADWIGIPVPAIISQALFDKVQERLAWNRKRYRNPPTTQLLSSLVKCGYCGSSFYSYQRYYTRKRVDGSICVSHKAAYRCAKHVWRMSHSRKSDVQRCESTEKVAHTLEEWVFAIIENTFFDPIKLRECMELFKTRRPITRMGKELEKLERAIKAYGEKKQRITNIYAGGDLPKEGYVAKSREYDNEIFVLTKRKVSILEQIPLFQKTAVVDVAIQQYCETAKSRHKQCVNFETKRQFLLDYIEKVTYWNDKIAVHGSVLVTMKSEHVRETETNKIEFRIEMKIIYSTQRGNKWGIVSSKR